MRGVGEATAAITLVNALSTGVGAAAGIELRAHAEIVLRTGPDGGDPETVVRPADAATPLVRAAVLGAIARFAPPRVAAVELVVRSDVPRAAGLKSSSAVTSAILLAVANASGREPSPEEVAGACAEIGRASGVSATGAFDDALAGLVGGAVVTDNRNDRLLRAHPVERGLSVALWIPPGTHPPAPEARSRFGGEDPRAYATVTAATDGRLWEALEINSEIVDAAMGYSYSDLRQRLRGAGAIGCGTSGLGPAFAAVGPRDRMPALLAELAGRPGRSFSVEFSRADALGGTP